MLGGDKLVVGTPYVAGANVTAKVIKTVVVKTNRFQVQRQK